MAEPSTHGLEAHATLVKPENSILPVGLILAAIIAIAAIFLARKAELRRVTSDPAPVGLFAANLQEELDRLENRYESRAALIFRDWRNQNILATQEGVSAYFGLESVSLLYRDGSLGKDAIVSAGKAVAGFEPDLTFREEEADRKLVLEEAEFFDISLVASGWFVTEHDDRLHFWDRRGKANLLVASVDPVEVRKVIDTWLGTSRRIRRSLLDGYRGSLAIESGSRGQTAWTLPDRQPGPERPSDHVHLVKNVFGTWVVSARDPVEVVIVWRWPVLIGGMVLSLCVAFAAVHLASAFREATRLAQRRVSFVNQASHELRSPITNILLHSDLAAESVGHNDQAAQKKIALIGEEAGRLSRLVDNVLTFSLKEREAFSYSLETTDPDAVVRQAVENFEPSFRRKGIAIDCDLAGPETMQTDPGALAQIVTNLVSNVEKYAASGKWLGIETRSCGEVEGKRILFVRISDRGPGIPAKSAETIFLPFTRLSDEVSEGVSGTGLGLAIARDLAQGLGGDLSLVDSDEIGAVFEVRIEG